MKKIIFKSVFLLLAPFYILVCVFFALIVRIFHKGNTNPKLVWGSKPLINNSYWSKSMIEIGFHSKTFVENYYEDINKKSDWDLLLQSRYSFFPLVVKPFIAFLHSLFLYDVFFISFSGYFIGQTPLWWIQAYIFKLARKKVVVMSYGGDSYVYRRIRSTGTIHGLMMSYPLESKNQLKISRNVEYWCRHGDFVMPGFMGADGFGRWDVLIPSKLIIDLKLWQKSIRKSSADGITEPVVVAHAPNHRGCKGTEFIINAVDKLKDEGLDIELVILEKTQNFDVREVFFSQVDILIEQLIITGYGLNGLEGLASGLPVISNLEDESSLLPFRRWSFLGECPIVSASPETILGVLRKLVTRPELRNQLGSAGRKYAEKYHSYEASQYLFGEIIKYLYEKRGSLINIYHPLLGEFPKQKPLVEHPLVNNHIVD